MTLTWQFYAFSSAIFAALTAIFGKVSVNDINSNLATFIRTVVILIFCSFLITFRKEWVSPEVITAKSIIFLILSALATGCSWLCYYKALQLGPASKVAPIDKFSVVIVVIFAVLFLGEELSWKTAIGTLLVGAGAILMAL